VFLRSPLVAEGKKEGEPVEKISKYTGLSKERIEQLK
jgi:hypothetical protein